MELADVDLNKLRTFAVIADRGGVTAAARALHLTRSAVSHSLAALEASLGVALFDRVGRGLVLTAEGEMLRRAFAEAAGRLDATLETLAGRRDEVRGTVHLGLLHGFSRRRLGGVIEDFLGRHPEARLRLVYDSQTGLHRQLRAGAVDMSLSLSPGAGESPAVESSRLFEQQLVLVARRRPAARRIDAETVAGLSVVDFFRSDPLIDRWIRHHFGARRRPRRNVRIWAGSADLALELVCRGVGACVLPVDLVAPHRRRRELVVVAGPREPLREDVWLDRLAGRRETRAVRALREALARAGG